MAQVNNQKLRHLLLFILPFLALIPPVAEKVRGLHSPQITLWAIVVTSIVCAILGLALLLLDREDWKQKRFPSFLQVALLATIIFLYIDIGFSGVSILGKIAPFSAVLGIWQKLLLHTMFFLVTTVLIGFLVWKLREDAINILALLFGVIAVSSLFISGQRSLDNWEREEQSEVKNGYIISPTLVIILDGMVGPEGIDRSLPGGEKLYWLVRGFHERNGFRLFGRAFSRYRATINSIPNTLNYRYSLDENNEELISFNEASKTKIMLRNVFFDQSENLVKDIIVYQTPYINYCRHPSVSTCKTLAIYDPLNGYMSTDLKLGVTVLFYKQLRDIILQNSIALKYVFSFTTAVISSFSSATTKEFLRHPHLRRYINLSFSSWWDAYQSNVLKSRSGELIFAHIFAPHAPADLDHQCRPVADWQRGKSMGLALTEKGSLQEQEFNVSREKHMTNYFGQVECVYKKLESLLNEMNKDILLRDANIVLMGDHGSRHSAGFSYEYLKRQDYIDNYSTLFSIKSPGLLPGYDERMISVQQLFRATQSDNMDAELADIVNTVVVSSTEFDEPVVVRMPDF